MHYAYTSVKEIAMEGALPVICIVTLLLILSLAAPAFAVAPVTVSKTEHIARGKALFTGAEPFAKGGAPCVACHAFRVLGITGGNLAADLTDLYEGLGEEGLKEVLKSLDFPLMKKIYVGRPLSDEEIGNLIAFAQAAAAGKNGGSSRLFPISGVVVFLCSLAVFALYRRRIG
jgi:hypothetical protein